MATLALNVLKILLKLVQFIRRGSTAPFTNFWCYWRCLWAEKDMIVQSEGNNPLPPTMVASSSDGKIDPVNTNKALIQAEGPIFSHRVSDLPDLPEIDVSGPTPKGTDEGSDTAQLSLRVVTHRRRVHSLTGVGSDEYGQDVMHMGGVFLQGEENLEKEIMELQSDFFDVRKEWPKEGNQYFIPVDDLRRLVTVNTILKQLKSSRPGIPEEELRQIARRAYDSAYKLFAILVCANKSNKFCEFIEEGISDIDLPFSRSLDSGQNGFLRSNQPPHNIIRSMKSWGLYQISNFSRDQWQMLSPIFERNNEAPHEVPHYEFSNNDVLPFIEDHEQEPGELRGFGGFSSVWAVVIHPAHQFLYSSPTAKNPRLAIKRLHSTEEKDFEVEVEMLKAFSNHRNSHLVKLLATYRRQGRYHLVFPYARLNLRKYWEETPAPEFSQTTISWMLSQCKGIVAGLYHIHDYKNSERKLQATLGSDLPHRPVSKDSRFGRHGDIKPENILWCEETSDHELGLLLIADFGLMEFHREHSRSNVQPETITGSPSYAPPELKLRLHISPAYDIWSLGCVFLEFVTWLVIGLQGLNIFPQARAFNVVNEFDDDTFYTIPTSEELKPYAVVRPGVTTWIQNLHRAPRCTKFVHEFLDLISKDMLVVEASDRIKCGALNNKLAEMLTRAQNNPAYLMDPTPWAEDERAALSIDLALSGKVIDKPPLIPKDGAALPRRNKPANLIA